MSRLNGLFAKKQKAEAPKYKDGATISYETCDKKVIIKVSGQLTHEQVDRFKIDLARVFVGDKKKSTRARLLWLISKYPNWRDYLDYILSDFVRTLAGDIITFTSSGFNGITDSALHEYDELVSYFRRLDDVEHDVLK